jgi:hypothetical protein
LRARIRPFCYRSIGFGFRSTLFCCRSTRLMNRSTGFSFRRRLSRYSRVSFSGFFIVFTQCIWKPEGRSMSRSQCKADCRNGTFRRERLMALKATIYKATIQLSDLDRQI